MAAIAWEIVCASSSPFLGNPRSNELHHLAISNRNSQLCSHPSARSNLLPFVHATPSVFACDGLTSVPGWGRDSAGGGGGGRGDDRYRGGGGGGGYGRSPDRGYGSSRRSPDRRSSPPRRYGR